MGAGGGVAYGDGDFWGPDFYTRATYDY